MDDSTVALRNARGKYSPDLLPTAVGNSLQQPNPSRSPQNGDTRGCSAANETAPAEKLPALTEERTQNVRRALLWLILVGY
jgi:hypothetical protein